MGDWLAFSLGLQVLGLELAGKFPLELLGIVFQHFSIAPMRGLEVRDGLLASVKADTQSLLAHEVGC